MVINAKKPRRRPKKENIRNITFLLDFHTPKSIPKIEEEWKKSDLILLEMAPEEFKILTSPESAKGYKPVGYEKKLKELLVEMKDKIVPIDNLSLRAGHLDNMGKNPLLAFLFKVNRDLYMAKKVKNALQNSKASNICVTVGIGHFIYHILKDDLRKKGLKVYRKYTFGRVKFPPLTQLERYIFFNLLREGRVKEYDMENLSNRFGVDEKGFVTISPDELVKVLPKELRELPRDKIEEVIGEFISEEGNLDLLVQVLKESGYSMRQIYNTITSLGSWMDAWKRMKAEIEKNKHKE